MRSQPHLIVVDIDREPAAEQGHRSDRGLPGAAVLALLALVPLAVYFPAAVVVAGLVAAIALLAHHLCSPGPGARG